MTGSLPARVPIPRSRFGSPPGRGCLAAFCVAAVVLLGVLLRPARADVALTDPPPHGAPRTAAPARVVNPPDEIGTRERRSPRPVLPHRPLVPAPPADGRDAPDPFILADSGRYLLYSTQVGPHNVPVATSPDLRRWSRPADALPRLPDWASRGRTWAPGVTRLDGRYVLYFTAHHQPSGRQCIGVAASATAAGPFVSQTSDPLVCQTHLGGSIDPHPFVDSDGSAFLLWKADGNAISQPSTLFAQRLRPDGLALAGQPVALLSSDAAWEQP